jgi:hypothetical protein
MMMTHHNNGNSKSYHDQSTPPMIAIHGIIWDVPTGEIPNNLLFHLFFIFLKNKYPFSIIKLHNTAQIAKKCHSNADRVISEKN